MVFHSEVYVKFDSKQCNLCGTWNGLVFDNYCWVTVVCDGSFACEK